MKYLKLVILILLPLYSCVAPALPTPTQTIKPSLLVDTVLPSQTNTITPEPTLTQTYSPIPTLTATPTHTATSTQIGGGSGKIIFTFYKEEFTKLFPDLDGDVHVFISKLDGSEIESITSELEKFNYLTDVSPDGKKVLVTTMKNWKDESGSLYLIDLESKVSKPELLVKKISSHFREIHSAAKWIDNNTLAYAGQGEKGFGIYIINSDGSNSKCIERNTAFNILGIDKTRLYYLARNDRVEGGAYHYVSYKLWWVNLEGTERGQIKYKNQPLKSDFFYGPDMAISPDGSKIAWIDSAFFSSDPRHYNYVHVGQLSEIDKSHTFETWSNDILFYWYPDNERVAVLDARTLNRDPVSVGMNRFGLFELLSSSGEIGKNYNFASYIKNIVVQGENNKIITPLGFSLDGSLIYGIDAMGNFFLLNTDTSEYTNLENFDFIVSRFYTRDRKMMFLP